MIGKAELDLLQYTKDLDYKSLTLKKGSGETHTTIEISVHQKVSSSGKGGTSSSHKDVQQSESFLEIESQ